VARLLRPVGVAPDVLKIEGKNVRTYQLHLFADAFMRYLPPEGADNRSGVAEADKTGTSGTFQNVAADPALRVGIRKKSNNDGPGYTATVEKGVEGQASEGGVPPEDTPLVCEHCGNPETTDQPVLEFNVEGVRCFLHQDCEQEWLGALAQSADD
jgi:hypothetical protein